jgi:cell wall-associated NlpC family hydrolase
MKHKCLFLCLILAAMLPTPASAMTDGATTAQDRPMIQALLSLGARYRYGGASPFTGFDCSGLVLHVFRAAWGVLLPRSAQEQSTVGTPVGIAELQPGDLVFYNTRNRAYSHVGIYLGEGRFIHAPRPGQRVRTENIQNPYWRARFDGARRIEAPAS